MNDQYIFIKKLWGKPPQHFTKTSHFTKDQSLSTKRKNKKIDLQKGLNRGFEKISMLILDPHEEALKEGKVCNFGKEALNFWKIASFLCFQMCQQV
jgi:hypothetical protein